MRMLGLLAVVIALAALADALTRLIQVALPLVILAAIAFGASKLFLGGRRL